MRVHAPGDEAYEAEGRPLPHTEDEEGHQPSKKGEAGHLGVLPVDEIQDCTDAQSGRCQRATTGGRGRVGMHRHEAGATRRDGGV